MNGVNKSILFNECLENMVFYSMDVLGKKYSIHRVCGKQGTLFIGCLGNMVFYSKSA